VVNSMTRAATDHQIQVRERIKITCYLYLVPVARYPIFHGLDRGWMEFQKMIGGVGGGRQWHNNFICIQNSISMYNSKLVARCCRIKTRAGDGVTIARDTCVTGCDSVTSLW